MLGLLPGDAVRVFYAPSDIGTINAVDINYSGERTDTGTVVQVGVSGTSLTLMSKSGVTSANPTGGNLRSPSGSSSGTSRRSRTRPPVARLSPTARSSPRQAPRLGHDGAFRRAEGSRRPGPGLGDGNRDRRRWRVLQAPFRQRCEPDLRDRRRDETFTTAGRSTMLQGVRVGEAITVSFVPANGGVPIAEEVQVAPAAPPSSGTPKATPPVAAPTGATPVAR